ncbi:MAG: hypothetical protein PHD37_03945 [Gallionellaceae bacterium]|nr:hypothetical protein [Gallionellaceae bacterium]
MSLCNREHERPDGRTTRALVPQLYVRVQDGDLQASGALIAADSLNLDLTETLSNSGTIAGSDLASTPSKPPALAMPINISVGSSSQSKPHSPPHDTPIASARLRAVPKP